MNPPGGKTSDIFGSPVSPALCEHTRTSPRYLYFCCCQSKKPAAPGSCRALSHACALPKNRTECAWSDFDLDTYSRSLFDSLLFWVYQISAVCCESINQTVDVRSKKKKKKSKKPLIFLVREVQLELLTELRSI